MPYPFDNCIRMFNYTPNLKSKFFSERGYSVSSKQWSFFWLHFLHIYWVTSVFLVQNRTVRAFCLHCPPSWGRKLVMLTFCLLCLVTESLSLFYSVKILLSGVFQFLLIIWCRNVCVCRYVTFVKIFGVRK